MREKNLTGNPGEGKFKKKRRGLLSLSFWARLILKRWGKVMETLLEEIIKISLKLVRFHHHYLTR